MYTTYKDPDVGRIRILPVDCVICSEMVVDSEDAATVTVVIPVRGPNPNSVAVVREYNSRWSQAGVVITRCHAGSTENVAIVRASGPHHHVDVDGIGSGTRTGRMSKFPVRRCPGLRRELHPTRIVLRRVNTRILQGHHAHLASRIVILHIYFVAPAIISRSKRIPIRPHAHVKLVVRHLHASRLMRTVRSTGRSDALKEKPGVWTRCLCLDLQKAVDGQDAITI